MTRRALVACVAAGALAACVIVGLRHRTEARYRTVELVLDGQDWTALIRREGRQVREVMAELQRGGATSVALADVTIKQLADDGTISYGSGGALTALGRLAALAEPFAALRAAGDLRADAVYITGTPERLGLVGASLRALLGQERVRAVGNVLEVLGTQPDLEELGLGFQPVDAEPYRAAGLEIVLRPRNYRGLTPASATFLIDGYARVAPRPTLIFALTEVLGYERLIAEAAEGYSRIGARFGRIEVFTERRKQRGEDRLTALIRPDVIRVFSVTPEELLLLRARDVADRFVRAAQERNIRLLYVRPLLNTPAGQSAIDVNLTMVRTIAGELRAMGFRTARTRPLPPDVVAAPLAVRRVLSVVVAVGAAALGLLVLGSLAGVMGMRVPAVLGIAVLVAAAVGTVAAGFTRFDGLWRQLLALGVAVAGATGATVWAMPREWGSRARSARRPAAGAFLAGWAALLRAVGLALIAGVLVAALLSRWEFMLAISVFLGVKVAHILPVVLVAVWLAFAERPTRGWRTAAREAVGWFNQPLRIGAALAVLILGLAAVMLLARTGNISFPLLGLEARLRTVLEDALVARPRTKEFLIGYPALAMMGTAAALGWRRAALVFGVVGAIGTAGAINSFSHLHTPVLYTVWRTGNALLLGAIIVLPALLVFTWIARRRPPS